MQVISRREACKKELKRFFTGKPCKHGHIAERFISSHMCRECNRLNGYNRTPQQIERYNAQQRVYKRTLGDDRTPQQIERYNASRRIENMRPEQIERTRAHTRICQHNRNALKHRSGGRISFNMHKILYARQDGKCVYCKISLDIVVIHLDHIMPLALGGSNSDSNAQLLCSICNLSKSYIHPDIYEARIGYSRAT